MNRKGWMPSAMAGWLFAWLLFPLVGWSDDKPYYHLTVRASFDRFNPELAEWGWATFVKVPKSRAFPEEAALAASFGGELRGSVLAFVRGAAWRSAYSRTVDTRCNDRPAEMEIYWGESSSESVYAGGGMDDPNNPERFSMQFTSRRIFLESGEWFEPRAQPYAFVGPVSTEGATAEEIRGDFFVQCVNYEDSLTHYRRCGEAWVKQYRPALCHFQHQALREEFLDGEDDLFGQLFYGPRDEKQIVYRVIRSSSREHPLWQRREM
jgi:hypothetical protein